MANRGTPLPAKIKNDAIVEALLDIRFEAPSTIPEVFYGRLIDHPHWKGLPQQRLPAYELPPQARELDPTVRYAPVLQLLGQDGPSVLRFGPAVLSYHRRAPYNSWSEFQPQLQRVIDSLFDTTENNVKATRIGLRYLNALTPAAHGINSIADLDLKLTIAEDDIKGKVNINLTDQLDACLAYTVRVSTKEFLAGIFPSDISIYVDVDVYTPDGFASSDKAQISQWVKDAHALEKREFFHLFTDSTLEQWTAR